MMKPLKGGPGAANLALRTGIPDASEGRLVFDLAPNAATRWPPRPAAVTIPELPS